MVWTVNNFIYQVPPFEKTTNIFVWKKTANILKPIKNSNLNIKNADDYACFMLNQQK